MNASSIHETEVLIIGAGPTGLVLALWLTRLGVQVRTLEFYAQMGLAEAVVERGQKMIAANLWVAGRKAARAVLGEMGADLSPFPYVLIFPQDEHERLLIDR